MHNIINAVCVQDPAEWLLGVKAAIFEALQGVDASLIKGMAVSGQQHGLVPLDEAKRVGAMRRQAERSTMRSGQA